MKFIKKFYHLIVYLLMLLKVGCASFHKNKFYIFGTPIHGNIGDHAIIYAEKVFLKDNFPKYKIIEIESNLFMKFSAVIKMFVGKSPIFITGGGFLGSLWLNEEEMFRKTLQEFPNNKIVVFPQTIYFTDDEEGNRILNDSVEIYSGHRNLFICCREKYSYSFMKKNFPSCNVLLIPDMVLYLKNIEDKYNRCNVLFCIRRDKEKINYNFNELEKIIKSSNNNIDYTDTVVLNRIYSFNRKKFVNNKISQFSKYKLIVTDRLHGMIFALLSNTPCIVFENKNYKIKGVYDWIKHVDYIKLCNNFDKNILLDLLNKNSSNNLYNNNEIGIKYKPLIELIDKK